MNNFFLFFIFFFLKSIPSFSQDNEGIKFINAKNWNEIKLEAKKTNKYIFLDAFTTWCAPCKIMTKEVFTKKEAGSYFNSHFINVAVQFDKTKNDQELTKSWYNDVKRLQIEYKIDSYPTYLFFNSDGELVYKIIGASENADIFISKASNALITEKQYYFLKSRYQDGERNTGLIKQLVKSANEKEDNLFISKVGNEYLSSQKNIYTKENIEIIKIVTKNSFDKGFNALRFKSNILDSILGKGESYKIVANIISNEIVIPYLRNGGSKTELGGGMIKYSGEIIKNVSWYDLEIKLKSKYPELAKKILLSSKPIYYEWTKEWDKFSECVIQHINTYPELLNDDLIRYYMWRIISNCDDNKLIKDTLNWIKKTKTIQEKSNPIILAGYSILLYKIGNINDALIAVEDAILIAKEFNQLSTIKGIQALKIKMEKGERAW